MTQPYIAPGMIHRPCIATLRHELDLLEAAGVPIYADLRISHLVNQPDTYFIREINPRPTEETS